MNKQQKIRQIAGIAVLSALTIILTIVSNYIIIGGISINLSLIPIVLAAIIFGPYAGFFVGLINGGFVMLSAQAFFAVSPIGTVIVCLLKTSVAGLLAGYLYKWLSGKNEIISTFATALIVPIVNTSLFIIGSLIFFQGVFGELISILVSVNFLIEVAINIMLAPAIIRIIKIVKK
ncbi:MAG: ECF transporter S component [Erysipelotrichales bacterium]|nr:ECF transporter S component [Erysipelotrichales bacterium]